MTKIVNVADQVSKEAQVNRDQIEHRATWMGLIYDEMVKAGVADAEGIVRRAIARTGLMHGQKDKEVCADPSNCLDFKEAFLSDYGMETFGMVTTEDEEHLDITFHYCPLCAAWQKLGFDDERCAVLCDMAMDGDRNIAKAMGLDIELTDKIADGCKTCHLTFRSRK